MIKILCEQVSPGLREADAILTFRDFNGRRHFLQIEKDLLAHRNGHTYLPVDFVHRDAPTGAFLIELPHEAESGFHRLWISREEALCLPCFAHATGDRPLAVSDDGSLKRGRRGSVQGRERTSIPPVYGAHEDLNTFVTESTFPLHLNLCRGGICPPPG
jgi:hypothetical protein